jgi:hypothetical protein
MAMTLPELFSSLPSLYSSKNLYPSIGTPRQKV